MIIYGVNPVAEALRSPQELDWVAVAKGKDRPALSKIRRSAEQRAIPIREVDDIDRESMARENQGVCASCASSLAKPLPKKLDASRYVLLDGLQDPHNFGAAIRVCECLGFRNIIYHTGDSCGLTPAAIKSSSGAIFHVRLFFSNLNRAVQRLQEDEIAICAMENTAEAVDLREAAIPEKYCLVLGSEGRGVRHNILRNANHVWRLPLAGKINSLNVSCALTAALWELNGRPSAQPS